MVEGIDIVGLHRIAADLLGLAIEQAPAPASRGQHVADADTSPGHGKTVRHVIV